MVRVMIVEDQKIIQRYLESFFREDRDYVLTASIESAEEAVRLCSSVRANLILMDVKTKGSLNGIAAAKIIKEKYPSTRILIVTSLADSRILSRARSAGADSLWYKDAGEEELMNVVKKTVEGKHVFPDEAPVVEIGEAKSYEFTRKETEVLRFLVKGYPYAKIAEEMGIEVSTVKYHVQNMLQKTGLNSKLMRMMAVAESKMIVKELD